jgi:lipopolysaccharide export system protein LptC
MNPDGTRRYSLVAKRMVHFPDDNSTKLDLPRLVYFDYERAPVTIRSETAEVMQGGDDVFFHGDVQIIRSAYASNAELGVFTSFLHVIPDKDLAQTDKPVRIVEGSSTASSVGLEFNNATREIKLLSEVKASYETPRRTAQKTHDLPRR